MNLMVPISGALFGLEGVCLVRFLFGCFQGSLFPIQVVSHAHASAHSYTLIVESIAHNPPIQTSILAGWLHEDERSTITALVGCCWSFFQAVQSTCTPYFMAGPGWQVPPFHNYALLL
jgi:hypothetical protein